MLFAASWCIYIFLAGKSPTIQSYTVHIYGSGQCYVCIVAVPLFVAPEVTGGTA